MIHVATTNIVKEYFPGRQIGPFGVICMSLNIATMVVPQMWKNLMAVLDWQFTLVVIGELAPKY